MNKWKLGHKSAIMVYRLTDDGEVWMNAERGLRHINAVEHLSAEEAINAANLIGGGYFAKDVVNALRAYAKALTDENRIG